MLSGILSNTQMMVTTIFFQCVVYKKSAAINASKMEVLTMKASII